MHNLFKGWKRKAGCVTLAIACVLTMVFVFEMTIELPARRRAGTTWIESGCLVHEHWDLIKLDAAGVIIEGPRSGTTYRDPKGSKTISANGRVCTFSHRTMGTGQSVQVRTIEFEDHSKSIHHMTREEMSLLYLIEPLVLLSAYLLLSKQPTIRTNEPPKDQT